jgi:hypothetical protein
MHDMEHVKLTKIRLFIAAAIKKVLYEHWL